MPAGTAFFPGRRVICRSQAALFGAFFYVRGSEDANQYL